MKEEKDDKNGTTINSKSQNKDDQIDMKTFLSEFKNMDPKSIKEGDSEEGEDEEEEEEDPRLFRKLRKSDSVKMLKIKQANKELDEEKQRIKKELRLIEENNLINIENNTNNPNQEDEIKKSLSGEGVSWFLIDIALVMRYGVKKKLNLFQK